MNDAELLDRLDARGRRAAASLRGAVTDVDVSAPDPVFARPPRRAVQRILAAAIVVVLGAGVTTLVTLGSDRNGGTDTASGDVAEGPRRFLPTWLPEGFVADIARLGNDEPVPDTGRVAVWGAPAATPRFAGPGMLVATYPKGSTEAEGAMGIGEQVPNLTVQGRPATYRSGREGMTAVYSGTVLTADGVQALQFEPDPDHEVVLSSRFLDQEALVRIAESARLEDEALVFDPTTLPEGWTELHGDSLDEMPGGWAPPTGSVAIYRGAGGRRVDLSVGAGDGERVDMLRAVGEDVREIEVRGHPALVGTLRWTGTGTGTGTGTEPGLERNLTILTWVEGPGEVVRIAGERISLEDLQQIAEGIAPVGDEEFAAVSPGPYEGFNPTSPDRPVVASGTAGGDTEWEMLATVVNLSDSAPDTTLLMEFQVQFATGPGNNSHEPGVLVSDIGPGTSVLDIRELAMETKAPMLYGIAPDGAARIEVRAPDGTVTEMDRFDLADEQLGVDAVVAEVPAGATTVEVVALAADGSEVTKVTVNVPGV